MGWLFVENGRLSQTVTIKKPKKARLLSKVWLFCVKTAVFDSIYNDLIFPHPPDKKQKFKKSPG